MRRTLVRVITLCAALLAGACAHMPAMPSLGGAAQGMEPEPGLSVRDRVRRAVDLLGAGEERQARVELRAVLEAQPNNNVARRLMDQIERDPDELLAGAPRAYTVRQGETMSVLAERFQGDALLFYALARYNRLDAPDQLAAGQTLMIPRRPGVTAAADAGAQMDAPPAPVTTSAARPSVDPARANQLRLQGLQHLNAGQVDRAVSLLRQAQALDEGNGAIQRDLDRALRLQASLRSPG